MKKNLFEQIQKYNGIKYIEKYLPKFFQIAEIDSSRDNKIGMEVGVVREKIIISLFIKLFGKKNVDTNIKTTEKELDVKCFNENISIKTITGFKGPKLIWTVDSNQAKIFTKNYSPKCSIILVIIDWDQKTEWGGLYYIPISVQIKILKQMKEEYFKLPKINTNPRGVEMSAIALKKIINEKESKKIKIDWKKNKINYDPLERWVNEWNKVQD